VGWPAREASQRPDCAPAIVIGRAGEGQAAALPLLSTLSSTPLTPDWRAQCAQQ